MNISLYKEKLHINRSHTVVIGFLVIAGLVIGILISFLGLKGSALKELVLFDGGKSLFGTAITPQIALLLLIIVVALVLFSFEWVSADVIALGLLLLLILTGLIPADQAFAGFGSDTVMMLLSLFILTAALLRTGVVEMAGRTILRYTGDDLNRLFKVIIVAAAGLSAVISNTAATAFFVPVVMGLANRARVGASKFLMPLAFAAILASSVTLVSTSTNIVVSGLMNQYNLSPMGIV